MTIRPYISALLLSVLPAAFAADDKKPAAAPAAEAPKEGSLRKDVIGFSGSISGTVEAVDNTGVILKVRVSKAEPDPAKNKAPKPDALAGMTISITPVANAQDGKSVLDEKASGYIKGAKSGDRVTLAVRASSKGDVFRLIKVPSAAIK